MCAFQKGNKYALGLHNGRPRKYENPVDLQKQVNKYFAHCKKNEEKLTITGLALFLGFCRRTTIYDLAKQGDEFSDIIQRAMMTIEQMYEERLSGQAVAGSIFALSNMGWKNRQAVEMSDPNGNPLPAPTQQINIGIDYSKLPTNVMDALLQARGPEQIEDAETTA